jgi:hypothetical protein
MSLCSHLSGGAAPELKLSESDSKDKLVAGLKSSFDYCSTVLDKLNDSDLGQETELFGGRKGTKAAVLFSLTNDWYDHYSQLAIYLRLSGLLPPTAKR